jgi:hypothetical protein
VVKDPAASCARPAYRTATEEVYVKNPLDSIWGTVISGFILTGILYLIARAIVSHAMGTGA